MDRDRNNGSDHESIEQWYCLICDKPISADRSPTRNDDNCSCVERAGLSGGGGPSILHQPITTSTSYDHTSTHPTFYVAPLNYTIGRVPPSNVSTNLQDIHGQEGIENHAPTLHNEQHEDIEPTVEINTVNSFLEVAPQLTDNERIAHKSFIFHSTYPPLLQRYLNSIEQFEPLYSTTSHTGSHDQYPRLPAGVLAQGMHYGNLSMEVGARSSRRSKPSHRSSGERSGGEQSYYAFHPTDHIVHMGTWADGEGDAYETGNSTYPEDFSDFEDFNE